MYLLSAFIMHKRTLNRMNLLQQIKRKRMERLKVMAKYGETKEFTYTDPQGTETEFKFNHVGLLGADNMMDEIRNENGQVSMVSMRKELFDHVIRTAEGAKVNYKFFEEKENGGAMLKAVTKAAQDYIFPKD
ncbi:MAG: hypothetical protein RR603_03785 [Kurthia sp.]